MSSRMSAICVFHKSFVSLRCVSSTTVKQDCPIYSLLIYSPIMANEHLATDLETIFIEFITEERILRLNKAIQMVYGGEMPRGAVYSENGRLVHVIEG